MVLDDDSQPLPGVTLGTDSVSLSHDDDFAGVGYVSIIGSYGDSLNAFSIKFEVAQCPDDCSECEGDRTKCSACIEDNQYIDEDGKCQDCDSLCDGCTGPGSNDCLDCIPDYVLFNGGCFPECPESESFITETESCEACHRFCTTCDVVDAVDFTKCTGCADGYELEESTC